MNKELKFKKYLQYYVDFEYLDEKVDFHITITEKEQEKKQFWDIIHFFKNKKILEPVDASFSKSIRIRCEDGEYSIESTNLIARQVLAVLLNLQSKEKSLYSSWYLYDYDSCNEMPQFIHSFFLAGDYKIIQEDVMISTSWMDDCDPNILVMSPLVGCYNNSSTPLWSNMGANEDALTKWYYQKFYRENVKGQIIAIRENFRPDGYSSSSTTEAYLKWIMIACGLILLKMFI